MYKRDYKAKDNDESRELQPLCKQKRKTQNIKDKDANDKLKSFANNALKNNKRSKDNDLTYEAATNRKATIVIYNDIDP